MKLKIRDIRKSFDEVTILNGAGYTFESGKVYCISGIKDAGKTTLLKCISGEIVPDGGKVEIDDLRESFKPDYRYIGEIFANPVLPDFMTGAEYIKYCLDLHSAEEKSAEEYLPAAGLDKETAGKLIHDYTDEQKFRLQLIILLITDPWIILIDEPFEGKKYTESILKEFLCENKGRFITLIATDNTDAAGKICDEVVLLKKGVLTGYPINLWEQMKERRDV